MWLHIKKDLIPCQVIQEYLKHLTKNKLWFIHMRGYTSEILKKWLKYWYIQQYNESKYLCWVRESMQKDHRLYKNSNWLTVPEIIAMIIWIIWLSRKDMRIPYVTDMPLSWHFDSSGRPLRPSVFHWALGFSMNMQDLSEIISTSLQLSEF